MTLPVHDPTSLSRLYHRNSEPWLNEEAYRGSPYVQEFRSYPDAPRTPLPAAGSESVVAALAASRRSARAFAPRPLPLATLAGLLRATYGIIGPDPMEGGGTFLRRTVPSAGGLYPLELYLLVHSVGSVDPGIYHFDAMGEGLERLGGDWRKDAPGIFYTWPFVEQAPVILCLAAMFDRNQKKYGPRGYRYIMLEAGHSAQNLCLAAGELGLATLCMGGFRDGGLNRLLGLAEPAEGVVYAVAVGN